MHSSTTKTLRMVGVAVAIAAAIALSGCSTIGKVLNAVDSATGTGDPTVFSLKVGDCFSEPTPDAKGLVGDIEFVKCEVKHDNEAFSHAIMMDATFPGDDATFSQADEACRPAFLEFIGADETYEGTLNYSYFVPTKESWDQADRSIDCYVYNDDGKTTGSLAGAAK